MKDELTGLKAELKQCRAALAEKEALDVQYHATSMELALNISEFFRVLGEISKGNYDVRVSEEALNSDDELMKAFSKELDETIADLREKEARMEDFHASSMELAMGLSECFGVLAAVRNGDLAARVSSETLDSKDELMANMAKAINDTIEEIQSKMALIMSQQMAIQELSTPVLQLWTNVLAMPIIGVVDSRRSAEIMERLLSEITARQSRFVILDITGVEIVDTKTADHFIKVIRAAELLGTRCILTGIRPAVAQTLVEIGVDLSSIITLRTLQDGLHECLRQMGQSGAMAQVKA